MNKPLRLVTMLLLAVAMLGASGCNHYWTNRYYDFRDTVAMGAGVTAENNITGIVPPSLGLYIEATDWLQLGAITHNGYTAETDLRGTYVGPEKMTRFGFLWWHMIQKNQDYRYATYMNPFKNKNFPWCQRMESVGMRYKKRPSKRLHYENWALTRQYGTGMLHRGYQYWEYAGVDAAICDPFFTHFGVRLYFGFDISEVSDLLLGFFTVDYKHDDMTEAEYDIFRSMKNGDVEVVEMTKQDMAPAENYPDRSDEIDALKAENEKLRDEVEAAQSRIKELEDGIQIELADKVFFNSGSNKLREEGMQRLDSIAQTIKDEYGDYEIVVVGHTDNQPISKSKNDWKSNWDLGAGRAIAVVEYLTDQAGMPKVKFGAMTYADNRPAADNDSAEGRQQNRRTVIVLRPAR